MLFDVFNKKTNILLFYKRVIRCYFQMYQSDLNEVI
jgi:hypothetical protein